MVTARTTPRNATAYRCGVRFRFLLRPSWLAMTLVVFSFAIICYTLLAPWQFTRNVERKDQNSSLQASLTAQPQPLDEVLPGSLAPDEQTQWHRISLTGSYLPQGEVVARLRTVQGEPAFEVLTPFRTDSGQIVLVDRGYLKPDSRTRVPSYATPPAGQLQLITRVRLDETDARGRDAFADESTDGKLHSYTVDSRVVARATQLPIRPGYFQLDIDQPGVLGALPLPKVEAGPFLSYALQWIAFGTMAILGWLFFTVRELGPGGALTTEKPTRTRRKSVSQLLAEDESHSPSAL